jgi:hypothetical protein
MESPPKEPFLLQTKEQTAGLGRNTNQLLVRLARLYFKTRQVFRRGEMPGFRTVNNFGAGEQAVKQACMG